MPVWNVFLPHSSDERASPAHKPLRNGVIARTLEVLYSKQETRCDTTKNTRPGAALAPRPQKRKCAARPRPTTSCVAGLGLGRLPLQSRIQRLLLPQPEKTGGQNRREPGPVISGRALDALWPHPSLLLLCIDSDATEIGEGPARRTRLKRHKDVIRDGIGRHAVGIGS